MVELCDIQPFCYCVLFIQTENNSFYTTHCLTPPPDIYQGLAKPLTSLLIYKLLFMILHSSKMLHKYAQNLCECLRSWFVFYLFKCAHVK